MMHSAAKYICTLNIIMNYIYSKILEPSKILRSIEEFHQDIVTSHHCNIST